MLEITVEVSDTAEEEKREELSKVEDGNTPKKKKINFRKILEKQQKVKLILKKHWRLNKNFEK